MIRFARNSGDRAILGKKNCGRCISTKQLILLDPNQGPDQLRDTLMHEIEHAIWDQTLLRLPGKLTQERVIEAMTPVRLDTYRRNPQLAAYLFDE